MWLPTFTRSVIRRRADLKRGPITPGRVRRGRPGVLFSALLLVLSLPVSACDRLRPPAARTEVELDSGSVALAEGARLYRIQIGGQEGQESISPASVQARPGDAIRFIVTDALTHAIAFDTASMSEPGRRFLASTSQVAGPPLIQPGTSWVVSLAGAPPGDYPFRCLSHGGVGRIVVGRSDPR